MAGMLRTEAVKLRLLQLQMATSAIASFPKTSESLTHVTFYTYCMSAGLNNASIINLSGAGRIDSQEIVQSLRDLGVNISEEQAEKILKR